MRVPWTRACSLLFRRSSHVSYETLRGPSVDEQEERKRTSGSRTRKEGGRGTQKGRYLVEMVCLFAVLAIPFPQWL